MTSRIFFALRIAVSPRQDLHLNSLPDHRSAWQMFHHEGPVGLFKRFEHTKFKKKQEYKYSLEKHLEFPNKHLPHMARFVIKDLTSQKSKDFVVLGLSRSFTKMCIGSSSKSYPHGCRFEIYNKKTRSMSHGKKKNYPINPTVLINRHSNNTAMVVSCPRLTSRWGLLFS